MRQQIKTKHRELVEHYLRFSDDKSPATDEEIRAFIRYESTGIVDGNFERIFRAKQNKELTIKMIYEEVFYFWSQGCGWSLPLIDIIEDPNEDRFFKANCQKIFDTLTKRGVANVLNSHTEFTERQKTKFYDERAQNIKKRK